MIYLIEDKTSRREDYGWTDEKSLGYYYDNSRRGDEFRWFLDLDKPVDITGI